MATNRATRPEGVFISYRRDDAPGHAGRLHDGLAGVLGTQNVFMDVAAIRPGQDFTGFSRAGFGKAVRQSFSLVPDG